MDLSRNILQGDGIEEVCAIESVEGDILRMLLSRLCLPLLHVDMSGMAAADERIL